MSWRILAIRPEPGCSATVAAGKAAGLEIEACPLFAIKPVAWSLPAGEFDGLLLGSANALRAGGPLVDNLVDKPVYAVGETTAAAARERGFGLAWTGRGSLQEVVDGLAGQGLRLLRLAGRERVPLAAPPGLFVETVVAYESIPLQLPKEVAEKLAHRSLVLLHSAAAARHFAAECDRLAVHRGDIRLAALAPRIGDAAGTGWAALRLAAEPNEVALLAVAREMCHDLPPA